MAALVVLGLVSVVADAILRQPRVVAAVAGLGLAAWCALRARRRARWPRGLSLDPADVVLRMWSRTPFEGRLLVTAAVGVWTAVGLGLVLGAAGLQLLVAAAASGLPLLLPQADAGELERPDVAPPVVREPAAAGPLPPDLGGAPAACDDPSSYAECLELSVPELLEVWRASSRALTGPLDPAQRSRIAAARSRYLDALQAHDPDGVADWLTSSHAQDRDPARFLDPSPATHRRSDRRPPGNGHGRPHQPPT